MKMGSTYLFLRCSSNFVLLSPGVQTCFLKVKKKSKSAHNKRVFTLGIALLLGKLFLCLRWHVLQMRLMVGEQSLMG